MVGVVMYFIFGGEKPGLHGCISMPAPALQMVKQNRASLLLPTTGSSLNVDISCTRSTTIVTSNTCNFPFSLSLILVKLQFWMKEKNSIMIKKNEKK